MAMRTPRLPNHRKRPSGPNVEFVRALPDSNLAKRFDPAIYKDGYGDFAHEFPGTHLRLTRGVLNAPIGWPWPGNDAGLYELLSHYVASGDEAPIEFLFKIINDGLTQNGRDTWTPRDFSLVAAEVYDVVEAREETEADRIIVPASGRRKTQDTFIVEKICATIYCSDRRGYVILRKGTSKLDQQKALALAFSNDPDRRLPRHWQLKSGGTWGSPNRDSFVRYVLDRMDPDAFEESTISGALAILAQRFEEGWLLDTNELECLLRTIREQALQITAETAVDLWGRYDQWRRRGF